MITRMTDWTIAFICTILTILVIANFTNSRHGRACISIREDEIAADAMGINTTYYKVIAFVLGSFLPVLQADCIPIIFILSSRVTSDFLSPLIF